MATSMLLDDGHLRVISDFMFKYNFKKGTGKKDRFVECHFMDMRDGGEHLTTLDEVISTVQESGRPYTVLEEDGYRFVYCQKGGVEYRHISNELYCELPGGRVVKVLTHMATSTLDKKMAELREMGFDNLSEKDYNVSTEDE